MTAKNTICVWYDTQAEEAARFYASVFPDSHVTTFIARHWTTRATRPAMS